MPATDSGERDDALDVTERVADAVLAVEGVHGLHRGIFQEVATYLPGRRVAGVRQTSRGTEIHVTLEWGAPIEATSELVRAAARPLVEGPIDVTVEDLVPPSAAAGDAGTAGPVGETDLTPVAVGERASTDLTASAGPSGSRADAGRRPARPEEQG